MKKLSLLLFFTLSLSLFLPCSPSWAYRSGSGLPSCHDDIASMRTEPGKSPQCAPLILDKDTALKFLKEFKAKKIAKKWFLFLSEQEFANLDTKSRWKTISTFVSAVTSNFGEQGDCFIARIPATDEEKKALLAGAYPEKLIAASGVGVEQSDKDAADRKWLEYHHPLLYVLSVY
ncbi:MAG: hypothetical protein KQH63_06535 [Desulfobulbaceae bacterium]|nr:hypothetical protein [Desulfobulbaceae bacterium]